MVICVIWGMVYQCYTHSTAIKYSNHKKKTPSATGLNGAEQRELKDTKISDRCTPPSRLSILAADICRDPNNCDPMTSQCLKTTLDPQGHIPATKAVSCAPVEKPIYEE